MTAKLETYPKDHYDQSVKNKKSSNIIDVTKKSASKSFTKLRKRISIFSSSSSSSLSSFYSSSSSSSSSPSSPSYSPPSHVSPLSSTGSFITSTKNSKFDFCYNNNKTSNNSMRIKGNKERKDIVIVGNNDDEDSTIENLYHQEVLRDEDEYNDGGYMTNVVGGSEYNGKYYYYYDDNYVAIAKNQSDKRSSIQSIKLAVKQFAGVGKERRRHSEAYHQDGKTNPFE